jgi:hypothetical protein
LQYLRHPSDGMARVDLCLHHFSHVLTRDCEKHIDQSPSLEYGRWKHGSHGKFMVSWNAWGIG